MIPLVIPTVPARMEMATQLATEVEAHGWASVRLNPHVDSRQDVANCVRLAQPDAADWWLYLEDDVILGPRFDDIPDLLDRATRKDTRDIHGIATFFRWRDDLPDDSFTSLPGNRFAWTQCYAARPIEPDLFEAFARWFFAKHPEHYHAPDNLMAAWLHHLHERHYVYSPSLVQHRAMPSTWKGRSTHRQSESFRRVFGDVEGAIPT